MRGSWSSSFSSSSPISPPVVSSAALVEGTELGMPQSTSTALSGAASRMARIPSSPKTLAISWGSLTMVVTPQRAR